jgi:5-formyltetrahydrofolate cyclo-ligase
MCCLRLSAGGGRGDRRRAFPLAIKPGMIVAGFSPMKTEINPIPLMRKLADAGAQLALPAIAGRGQPLIMRPNLVIVQAGQWGIRGLPRRVDTTLQYRSLL